MTDDVVIGGDTAAMERLFDDFLRHMEQFDRRLSVQTQKIILRNAAAPAIPRDADIEARGKGPPGGNPPDMAEAHRPGMAIRTHHHERVQNLPGGGIHGLGMEQQRGPEDGVHKPAGETPAAAEARHVYRHMGRPWNG